MGQAAHAIGNTELEDKFTKSLDLLERPNTVVFNPSYVLRLASYRRTLLTVSQIVSLSAFWRPTWHQALVCTILMHAMRSATGQDDQILKTMLCKWMLFRAT